MLVSLFESGIILRSRKRGGKTDSSFLPVFQPACLPACSHLILCPATSCMIPSSTLSYLVRWLWPSVRVPRHFRREGFRRTQAEVEAGEGWAKISPPHSDHTGFGREGPLHNRGWRRRRGGKDTELLCKPPSLPLPIMALAGGAGNSSPRRRRRRHSCSSSQPAFSKNHFHFQSIWDARCAYGERFLPV